MTSPDGSLISPPTFSNAWYIDSLPFCNGDFLLLHLHSFPTRRSSDLDNISDSEAACLQSLSDSVAAVETAQDRKSTRLNSSHLGISYAVFCLKKKIR